MSDVDRSRCEPPIVFFFTTLRDKYRVFSSYFGFLIRFFSLGPGCTGLRALQHSDASWPMDGGVFLCVGLGSLHLVMAIEIHICGATAISFDVERHVPPERTVLRPLDRLTFHPSCNFFFFTELYWVFSWVLLGFGHRIMTSPLIDVSFFYPPPLLFGRDLFHGQSAFSSSVYLFHVRFLFLFFRKKKKNEDVGRLFSNLCRQYRRAATRLE